jgi:fatty acid desaturase
MELRRSQAKCYLKTMSIHQYVTGAEIRELTTPRPLRLALDVALIWAFILGSLWFHAHFMTWWSFFIAFATIATRQHALNNFVHEASHFNLTRNRKLNDWVSDAFCATPHLINTENYRRAHLPHHTHLGSFEKDQEIKYRFLLKGWGLPKYLLLCLSGFLSWKMSASKYLFQASAQKSERGAFVRYLGLVAFNNLLLLGYCWWLDAPLSYFYLWVLPLFTLTQLLALLRVVAEHQPQSYAERPSESFDTDLVPAITRTIPSGALQKFALAPLNFCYHHEHHELPMIPYPNLPRLYALLMQRGYYEAHPEFQGASYFSVLRQLVGARPATSEMKAAYES